jgi:hypothetical protein
MKFHKPTAAPASLCGSDEEQWSKENLRFWNEVPIHGVTLCNKRNECLKGTIFYWIWLQGMWHIWLHRTEITEDEIYAKQTLKVYTRDDF